jgi:hypothetical protein
LKVLPDREEWGSDEATPLLFQSLLARERCYLALEPHFHYRNGRQKIAQALEAVHTTDGRNRFSDLDRAFRYQKSASEGLSQELNRLHWSDPRLPGLAGSYYEVSLQQSAGETISICPERALRAWLALRVVDSFFVWAANDAIGHDDVLGAMRFQELKHIGGDLRVSPDVERLRIPFPHGLGFRTFVLNDRGHQLARSLIRWAVACDRRGWITTKSLVDPLSQFVTPPSIFE